MAVKTLPKRDEISSEYKWKIEDIYESIDAWQKDYDALEGAYVKLSSFEGELTKDAKTLADYLTLKDTLMIKLGRLIVYAHQKSHEDLGNTVYQELASKIDTLSVKVYSSCAFECPEILTMSKETLEQMILENDTLKGYQHYLEDILRGKDHTLTPEIEVLLSDLGDFANAPERIFTLLNNVDLKYPSIKNSDGEDVQLTNGLYVSYLENKDRKVREAAFKTLYGTIGKFKNTIASIFDGNVKKELFYAKARKYNSPLEMSLDANAIDVAVYDRLIETVHEYLPAMYDYVSLRKKMLGVDELHMYDVYASIAPNISMSFTFEEAKEVVLEGLSVMGEEYTSLLKKGFNEGWIDVYENEGKRSGAYSWGSYDTHPYVLLNYHGTLDNVFTLAHEMGHALHSWYSNHNQNYVNSHYSLFVAEVASTCNEMLLIQHLLKKVTDDKEKMYLINHYLDTIKGTLFRQTMFAEFEKKVYEMAMSGTPLTADSISGLYYGLNQQYFGEEMINDEEIALEWARIPHFYSPFYVYQYATGVSAASAFAKNILEDGNVAVENYKVFLKGGCSKYPLDILADAGVDMRSKAPVAAALETFKAMLSEAKELVGKHPEWIK